jgi:hypothetical protein
MKYLWTLLFVALVGCSHQVQRNDPTLLDEYWDRLIDESHTEKISITEKLKKDNLALYNQIQNDAKDPTLLGFWGKSFNSDGGMNLNGSLNKQIVDLDVLSDIQKVFGIKNDNIRVHAGITHTYGYLFSRLVTPYGFKRKRWTAATLNHAFDFKNHSLSPVPNSGSLLSNLTYFAGKLSFRNADQLSALEKLQNTSEEVKAFDYKNIKKLVVIENVAKPKSLNIVTTLIALPKKAPKEENDYLLIYSLEEPKSQRGELITAFPIKKEAYLKIINPEGLGENKEISLRYNAYKEGFGPERLLGQRSVLGENRSN